MYTRLFYGEIQQGKAERRGKSSTTSLNASSSTRAAFSIKCCKTATKLSGLPVGRLNKTWAVMLRVSWHANFSNE